MADIEGADGKVAGPAGPGGTALRQWPAAPAVSVEGPLAHVGLEALADAGPESSASAVRFRALPVTGMLALRGSPDALGEAVRAATGLDLPGTLGTSVADAGPGSAGSAGSARSAGPSGSAGDGLVLRWRSPDEWLLSCPIQEAPALVEALEGGSGVALGGSACIVDVSAGFALFELAGEGVDAVLARSTSYDLDALAPGRAVSTTLAKTTVMLRRIDDARVELVVRRSFADYVWTWLQRAAAPGGLAVEPFRESVAS